MELCSSAVKLVMHIQMVLMTGSSSSICLFLHFLLLLLFLNAFLQDRISLWLFYILFYSFRQSALGNRTRCIKLIWQLRMLGGGLIKYMCEQKSHFPLFVLGLCTTWSVEIYASSAICCDCIFLPFTLYMILDQRCKKHMTAGALVL